MPHTIPGCVHPSNSKDSVDWDDKGLLAYSAHNVIFLVDVTKMQRIQALDMHSAAINIIRWSPEPKKLASSDISGQIIISDPLTAQKLNQFHNGNSAVQQMYWYPWKDIARDFILVLHSQNCLILWNVLTGEKVWSHQFSHFSLFDFSLDPFCSKNLIFSSSGNKVLVTCDVSLSEPQSSGHIFQVLSENSTTSTNSTNIHILKYHKAYRNVVFVGIQNFIYLVNPELMCCLSKIGVESNILDILPCSRRDSIFGIHSNGAVTLRIGTYEDKEKEKSSFGLEKICQTECIRHGSSQKIIYRKSLIEDFLSFERPNLETKKIGDLSIYQLETIGSLAAGVTCVRMRPMDELAKVENDPFANTSLGSLHLAAVGTNSGTVHLIDVFTSQIYRDISVQASPIKCLEWGGVYSLVTAGFNHSLSASQIVRNEIFITDIRTGLARRIRPEVDESPISILRVSYYHCYLALAFQREPLEIWDLKGLRLLRRMSRSCPLIVDMAWSNKHHSIKQTESTQQSVYRENLVLLDAENRIYHITLRGLHVRDGKMVNTQWKSASAQICAMAWKDDMLAVGDVEGSLVVWDLGKRQSRQVRDISHSRVHRMLFSRLAGDHTMAVLHSREVTLWDTEAMSRIQTIRSDSTRLFLDADLCGLSPLVLSNDNQLRFVVSNSKNIGISEKEWPVLYKNEENEKENDMKLEKMRRRMRGEHFGSGFIGYLY
ncbi:unnamed protein product [Caenorhabditis angaria]|uniref:WDR11 second beta-propeller domain-containing protein n=1 Tax=Caenorhabditis angaria TaxID=860376 RepID=A0A9P1I7Y3_9PELO|nr:unnamed protein product [Caenorhabditis angaria]